MAITIVKSPQDVYSSLPNYMIMTSDNSNENKFEYVVDIVYNPIDITNLQATQIDSSTGAITCTATLSTVNHNLKVNETVSSVLSYSNKTYGVFNIDSISGTDIVLTINEAVYSTAYFALFLDIIFNSGDTYDCKLNKFVRKRISPDGDGNGVVDFNSVMRNEVFAKYKDYESGVDLSNYKVEFSYVIFEDFLFKLSISGTGTPSDALYNRFEFSDTLNKNVFDVGDAVVVRATEPNADEFYNGVQICTGYSSTQGYFETDKPQKNGEDTSDRIAYRADQQTTVFIENTNENYTSVSFGNPYFNDFAGLSNFDYTLKLLEIRTLNNVLIPTTQDVTIDDLGYFVFNPTETTGLSVDYNIYDSNGLDINYTINLTANDSGFYYIPSHPETYNQYIDINGTSSQKITCDHTYYTIVLNSNSIPSETYRYNLKKLERVRLVYSDNYGHYQGFNFFGNCVKTNTVDRFRYKQNYSEWDGSNNIITYDNLSRGTTDINSVNSETWVLNTTYLTDEQSEYFKTLLTSSDVYIQDYEGNFNACNVNTSSFVEKRNKNGLVRYTVNISLSNSVVFYGN